MKQRLTAHRSAVLALAGALLGLVAFLCIHTAAPLDVTNDAWILSGYVEKDIIQHYTGWLFYREAPLQFPLGFASAMQYPQGTALTYTDSIPLLGILFRFIEPLLPETFQYFGLFTLCCYMAQGAGAALLVGLFLPDMLMPLLGAGMFLLCPVLNERAFRHTALAAQFLIVFALYLYFKDARSAHISKGWLALSVLAATVHPYFVPMILALLLAAMLARCGRLHSPKPLLAVAVNTGAALLAAFCIGAFSTPASGGISGYGYFCMNLNALFNPISRGDIVWSRLLPALPQGLGTYDGFNYLGLGVLAFGMIGLIWWLCAGGAKRWKALCARHGWLLAVCAVFTVFAVSNVIVWNGAAVFSLPLPHMLLTLGNIFRSSGRMFWPVSYLLLLCTVVFWARRKKPVGAVCVAALLCVQLWDVSPALAVKREAFTAQSAAFENPMQSEVWSALAGKYKHIFSFDSTLVEALYPALWAAQNGMTTNDGFTARFDEVTHGAQADAQEKAMLAGEFDVDTLYLTCDGDRFYRMAEALLQNGADVTCAKIDRIWYAIIPHRADVVLPAQSDSFWVYPEFPLMLDPIFDANWTYGVLNSNRSVCTIRDNSATRPYLADATALIADGKRYTILDKDYSDAGWVMLTMDMDDATILIDKILTTETR